MTSFVHVDQPTSHPGVVRAEARLRPRARCVAELRRRPRAGGAAARRHRLVAAGRRRPADVDTWSEGGLLVAWLVLWVVAFAALAFFAGTARSLAARAVGAASRSAAQPPAAARADEQFLAQARVRSAHPARPAGDRVEARSRSRRRPGAPCRRRSTLRRLDRSRSCRRCTQALRRVNLGQLLLIAPPRGPFVRHRRKKKPPEGGFFRWRACAADSGRQALLDRRLGRGQFLRAGGAPAAGTARHAA